MESMGLKFTPVVSYACHLSMFRHMVALLGPIDSPNSPNQGFNSPPSAHPPPPPTSPTPLYVLLVILHCLRKKLLIIQQCKIASRNSYKSQAKTLF